MSEPRRSTPPVSTMVGAVLGAYRITSELSSGGMGTVYRGEHELLGRPAAIKLLRSELTHDDALVQRFFNEAKAATAIRHPGIIEVYDFGYTDEGFAYLVMEFLEGSQLGKRIDERKQLTETEAAQIARGIASALKAAHAKGIFHRDLKPDNIFLVPDPDGPTGERVKVLDFGIAKLNDPLFSSGANVRHTQTGVLMGTPLYMAPEQARAAATVDARADLYSLGCILYEMLVGRPPFVSEAIGEIIALQMFEEPKPPRELRAEITPEMEALVLKLLAKEPDDRFQSAADLIVALTALGTRPATAVEAAAASAPPARPRNSDEVAAQPTLRHTLKGSLADEAPEHVRTERRSALPLIAGAITLAIAVVAIAVVLTRDDAPAVAAPLDAAVALEPDAAPPAADAPVALAPPPPDAMVIVDAPVAIDAAPRKPASEDSALPPAVPRPLPVDPPPVNPPPPEGSGSAPPRPTTNDGSPIEIDLDDEPRGRTP